MKCMIFPILALALAATVCAAPIAVLDPYSHAPKNLTAGTGVSFSGNIISAPAAAAFSLNSSAYLRKTGNGSSLTGITSAQVGAKSLTAFNSYSTAQASAMMLKANTAGVGAAVRVLAQSAVAQSIYTVAGWTSSPLAETTLATYTIPGGTMGLNGALRVATLSTHTNSANTKTVKVNLASTQYLGVALTTSQMMGMQKTIRNRNSASSQVAVPGTITTDVGVSPTALTTSSANTAIDQNITVTGTTSLETGAAVTAVVGAGGTCTATLTAHGLNTGEYVQMAGGANCPTSGNPNANPIQVTVTNANTFTYVCSCVGTEASTMPTEKRYSVIQLEGYTIELLPGAN